MLGGFFSFFNRIFFLTSYVNNGSFPKPLKSEEEKIYLYKYKKEGDKEAREILIKHNLRLVAHIVKKYNGSAEMDDLISVGTIGLIKAIETFNMEKGTSLATFSAKCIENEILMMLRSNKKFSKNVSLQESVGVDKEGNELTLMDLLYEKEDGVFSEVELSLLSDKFLKLLKKVLNKREYIIVVYRYGLRDRNVKTQKEVSKMLNISRSYVSRIEKKALEKIKEELIREKFFD